MTKSILFDFDGTIVESEHLLAIIFNSLSSKYGYGNITMDEIESLRDLSITDKLKKFGFPLYKLPSLFLDAKKIYKENVASLKVKSGVLELLRELHMKKVNISIISSNDVEIIKSFFHNNKIDFFDNVESSNNLFGKHHTIKNHIRKHSLKKENTFYVGDEVRDIVSCKKAKIKVIAVTWGYDSEDLLKKENPDFIINKPSQILDIVL